MHGDSLLLDETFQDGRMMHAWSRDLRSTHDIFVCLYIYIYIWCYCQRTRSLFYYPRDEGPSAIITINRKRNQEFVRARRH